MLLISPLANLFTDCLASCIIAQLGKVNRSSVSRFLSICTWTGTSVCVTTAGQIFGMKVSEAEETKHLPVFREPIRRHKARQEEMKEQFSYIQQVPMSGSSPGAL